MSHNQTVDLPADTASRPQPVPGPELELEFDNMQLSFASVEALRLEIEARPTVPAARIATIAGQTTAVLTEQARSIRAVEGQLLLMLESNLASSESIGARLAAMDPRCFSQDNDWKGLFAALVEFGEEYEAYKRVAVVKYLEYLAQRQSEIGRVFAAKTQSVSRAEPDVRPTPVENPAKAAASVADSSLAAAELTGETSLFDVRRLRPDRDAVPEGATKLPRGEPCLVRQTPELEVALWLSNYRFRLMLSEHPCLIDEAGTVYPLPEGEFSIGRSKNSDVVVDNRNVNVSRRHLLCELVDADCVSITDLSSHGTFLEQTAPASA